MVEIRTLSPKPKPQTKNAKPKSEDVARKHFDQLTRTQGITDFVARTRNPTPYTLNLKNPEHVFLFEPAFNQSEGFGFRV